MMKYIMTMQEKQTQSEQWLIWSKKKIAGNVHCSEIIPLSLNWDKGKNTSVYIGLENDNWVTG